MKKLIFLLLTLAVCQGSAYAQTTVPDGITFCSQSAIDNFQVYYPGYTEIEGDVTIGFWVGSDITNLEGLKSLKVIGGNLRIDGNPLLTDLTGLSNLESVSGTLVISWNNALTSLRGLEHLISTGGVLEIYWNESLTTLSGLQNLDPATLIELTIAFNHSLSSCELAAICECLDNQSTVIKINDNAVGCNSAGEVKKACSSMGLQDLTLEKELRLYPNPTENQVNVDFTLLKDAEIRLEVMNSQGKTVAVLVSETLSKGKHHIGWNSEDLPAGMYVYRLSTTDNRQSTMGKLVVK
jgi:hypothetical protein